MGQLSLGLNYITSKEWWQLAVYGVAGGGGGLYIGGNPTSPTPKLCILLLHPTVSLRVEADKVMVIGMGDWEEDHILRGPLSLKTHRCGGPWHRQSWAQTLWWPSLHHVKGLNLAVWSRLPGSGHLAESGLESDRCGQVGESANNT